LSAGIVEIPPPKNTWQVPSADSHNTLRSMALQDRASTKPLKAALASKVQGSFD